MRSLMMALAALAAISFTSAPAMAADADAHKATETHQAKAEQKHEKKHEKKAHKKHHKAHKKEHKMEKKKEGDKK